MNGKIEPLFEANLDAWDPDEVFTKHTVAEVKVIQQRLRYVTTAVEIVEI